MAVVVDDDAAAAEDYDGDGVPPFLQLSHANQTKAHKRLSRLSFAPTKRINDPKRNGKEEKIYMEMVWTTSVNPREKITGRKETSKIKKKRKIDKFVLSLGVKDCFFFIRSDSNETK